MGQGRAMAMAFTSRYAVCTTIQAVLASICINDMIDTPYRQRMIEYPPDYRSYLLYLSRYGVCWFAKDWAPYSFDKVRRRSYQEQEPVVCCRKSDRLVNGIWTGSKMADEIVPCTRRGIRNNISRRIQLHPDNRTPSKILGNDTLCVDALSNLYYRCFVDTFRSPSPNENNIYTVDVHFT